MTRRSMNPEFDQRIADWLEDDPDAAPGATLETVLAAFPSIPQRHASRVPWRLTHMYRPALIGAAATIAIVLIAGALVFRTGPSSIAAPSAAPAPTPSPAAASGPTVALDGTFTSSRFGLSIRHPAAWSVVPATSPWDATTFGPTPPDPRLDELDRTPGVPAFTLVSGRVPSGETATTWLASYERAGAMDFPPACWPSPDQMEAGSIDGQRAWTHGGKPGCNFTEAVVFAGDRVYLLTGYGSLTDPTVDIDRALFDAVLSTTRLDPTKADDSGGSPRPSGG